MCVQNIGHNKEANSLPHASQVKLDGMFTNYLNLHLTDRENTRLFATWVCQGREQEREAAWITSLQVELMALPHLGRTHV